MNTHDHDMDEPMRAPFRMLSERERVEAIEMFGSEEEYDRAYSMLRRVEKDLRIEARRVEPDPQILPRLHMALEGRHRRREVRMLAMLRRPVPLYQSIGGALAVAALLFVALRLFPAASATPPDMVVEGRDTVRIHDTIYVPSADVESPHVAVTAAPQIESRQRTRRSQARSGNLRLARAATRDSGVTRPGAMRRSSEFDEAPDRNSGFANLAQSSAQRRGVSLKEDSAFRKFQTGTP